MKNGINTRYVQFETSQGIGYGCFITHWNREGEKLVYRIGASFCNPNDNFSKSLARAIAKGRAEIKFQHGSIESKEMGFITNGDFKLILKQIFDQASDDCVIPNWAYKAFVRGNFKLSLRCLTKSNDKAFYVSIPMHTVLHI